jgi:hypothetical protein
MRNLLATVRMRAVCADVRITQSVWLGNVPRVVQTSSVLEFLHTAGFIFLVVAGLPLLPFVDLYMVLSAWVLIAESGESGYIMRAAEDFCRQYERVRLPMECFFESLPQTGLQVRTCAVLGKRAGGWSATQALPVPRHLPPDPLGLAGPDSKSTALRALCSYASGLFCHPTCYRSTCITRASGTVPRLQYRSMTAC